MEISKDQKDGFTLATAVRRYSREGLCGAGDDRDANHGGFPVITVIMIATHTILYCAMPGDKVEGLCALPLDDFGFPRLMLSTVASAFFHPDFGHYFMNMMFLSVFGALLEPRITPGQYLAAVLLGSVLSRLISLNLLLAPIDLFDASDRLLRYPPAGASGTISCLMGFFALRCGVSRRSVRQPHRCHPLLYFPIPVSATVLIGLFFIKDLVGHTAPAGTIDCWGHVGGFLGGLALALVGTLQDDEPGERREQIAQHPNGGLGEDAGNRHHREVLPAVSQNASTRCRFLPVKPPSKVMHRRAVTTG